MDETDIWFQLICDAYIFAPMDFSRNVHMCICNNGQFAAAIFFVWEHQNPNQIKQSIDLLKKSPEKVSSCKSDISFW